VVFVLHDSASALQAKSRFTRHWRTRPDFDGLVMLSGYAFLHSSHKSLIINAQVSEGFEPSDTIMVGSSETVVVKASRFVRVQSIPALLLQMDYLALEERQTSTNSSTTL
jgi:hypothetical protein